jgi:hypothetical protein
MPLQENTPSDLDRNIGLQRNEANLTTHSPCHIATGILKYKLFSLDSAYVHTYIPTTDLLQQPMPPGYVSWYNIVAGFDVKRKSPNCLVSLSTGVRNT